jgi:peptide/nickel transport system ATP-binding protein
MDSTDDPLLEVWDLSVEFRTNQGTIRPVDRVSWSVGRGRTLAIVGESGCGKSVTALSILRLIPDPPARIVGGRILFHDQPGNDPIDLAAADERALRSVRGRRIGIIFQEAMTALNPVLTIGQQIVEVIELHRGLKGGEAWNMAVGMLREVGIAAPEECARGYPHQLSGGMRQRAVIAMTLACKPALLIADEPTTALDVTVQAQILELLAGQQARIGMSLVFITHDLGLVAQIADQVCVMYAGRVIEQADVHQLFDCPLHPYTRALLRCVPRLTDDRALLEGISGQVPDPRNLPAGCRFHPRCPLAVEACRQQDGDPSLHESRPGHLVACGRVQA